MWCGSRAGFEGRPRAVRALRPRPTRNLRLRLRPTAANCSAAMRRRVARRTWVWGSRRFLLIIHDSRKIESADDDHALAAHRMRGLRAKAARLQPILVFTAEPPLRQGIHGAAAVAARAIDAIGALHDDRQIRAGRMQRFAFANAGQAEQK